MYYCDHNATTPVHVAVLNALCARALIPSNASSLHRAGQEAAAVLDRAAQAIRQLVHAPAQSHVTFVSGGTEADDLLIGIAMAIGEKNIQKRIVLASRIEHPAVLGALEQLEYRGFKILWLPVCVSGVVDLRALEGIDRESVALAVMMRAHNETGVLQPVAELAFWAQGVVPIFSDAVQAVGKVSVDMQALGVSALTLTGHKFGGPRGIGAVVHVRELPWQARLHGGEQQEGRRAGTEPVALIEGLGVAAEYAHAALIAGCVSARQVLKEALQSVPGVWFVDGGKAETGVKPNMEFLCNTLMLGVEGIDARSLLAKLDAAGVCASAGAACHGHAGSSVLAHMGYTDTQCNEAMRFSFAPCMTAPEDPKAYHAVADRFITVVQEMRGML